MSSTDGSERGRAKDRAAVQDQPESEGVACRWHASNADRAEGETAERRKQAKRNNEAARKYVTFLPAHIARYIPETRASERIQDRPATRGRRRVYYG